MENDELRSLIEKCQQNDKRSQKKLYDQFSPMLFAICLRYANCREEAEDSLIDAYQRIFSGLESFQFVNASLFVLWIKKITINRALYNYHRNKEHIHHSEIDDEIMNLNRTDTNTASALAIDAQFFLGLIQQLPQWASTIINLMVIDDYSTKEVAQMLNITVPTARSRLSKARALLKSKVETIANI